MRATVMFEAGDVRIEKVPDPKLSSQPTQSSASLVPAFAGAICGLLRIWNAMMMAV